MQIWNIPPKYLDTESLETEHSSIVMFLDSKKLDFDGWDGYLLCRVVLIERELKRRDKSVRHKYSFNPHDFSFSRTPSFSDVQLAITQLKEYWRDKLGEDSILEHFDMLSFSTPEEIYYELEWILELQRKELFL